MKAASLRLVSLLFLLLAGCAISPATQDTGPYVIYETRGKYDDVLEDVRQAIIGRGMVIGAVSHVAEMLDRTSKDLGNGKPIYGAGEVQLFCSAVLSRKAMESDARNIIFCPYGIAVWSEIDKPGRVFVGYRRADTRASLPTVAVLKDIEKLLDDIVREATRK